MIREIQKNELNELLTLYLYLHETEIPTQNIEEIWEEILSEKNHHIIVAEENGKLVSSCVCVVIPNLTRKGKSYAIIENVVTHEDYRNQGLASTCLDYAAKLALESNCYKIMLLTGSDKEETKDFYRKSGYNDRDKTAFIMWI